MKNPTRNEARRLTAIMFQDQPDADEHKSSDVKKRLRDYKHLDKYVDLRTLIEAAGIEIRTVLKTVDDLCDTEVM